MQAESTPEISKPRRYNAPGGPPGNQKALKHGFAGLKRAVNTLGNRAIDRRTVTGRALAQWRQDLIKDLGGDVSTQQSALVDLCVKSKLLLDSIDAWLLTQPTLVIKRKKSLIPVVVQRQQLADGLAKYLNQLGLERRHKVKTLHEILSKHDDNPPEGGNGAADEP